jgi:hypothetical protein
VQWIVDNYVPEAFRNDPEIPDDIAEQHERFKVRESPASARLFISLSVRSISFFFLNPIAASSKYLVSSRR